MHRPLPDDLRFRALRLLERRPDISQRELARELGVALGSVNHLLSALIAKGLVKARNFRNARNKLAYAYMLTPQGAAEKAALTAGFMRRKLAEYEALKRELEELTAEVRGADIAPQAPGRPVAAEKRV